MQVWCGTYRPEYAVNSIKTDVHSPGKFRSAEPTATVQSRGVTAQHHSGGGGTEVILPRGWAALPRFNTHSYRQSTLGLLKRRQMGWAVPVPSTPALPKQAKEGCGIIVSSLRRSILILSTLWSSFDQCPLQDTHPITRLSLCDCYCRVPVTVWNPGLTHKSPATAPDRFPTHQ